MGPGVVFTPDDTDWRLPSAGPGLLLDVPSAGPWLQRPSLHVEVAPRYRLRVNSGGQPLLWARIDDWWDGCGMLWGTVSAPWGLPPLSAAEVRGVPHDPGSPRWWETWTRHVAGVLVDSPHPVLHSGRWCLRPLRRVSLRESAPYPCIPSTQLGSLPDPPHSLERILRIERFGTEDWASGGVPAGVEVHSGAVLPLRAPSPEDDGRVKRWRKLAREGTLPPALLLYVELIGKWLVLDGHDRLHAALLEGLSPPLLGLWPVVETQVPVEPFRREGMWLAAEAQLGNRKTPEGIDGANRTLLREFAGSRRAAVTRAWPVRGGVESWRAEVLAWRRWSPFPVDEEAWEWFVSPGM
ncbi:hypothetical protein [Vitiosangium sp. GDMCC 1.1324]|uniref:hypothetical protein n=1 Tax=Vitiosangium sp. (strain GDMCC 1.1324) TaxID=2138576 RepID=UPI000D3A61FF|nr:hypothetical protein [Vitiosangium sp. GDMCC 1.1324]PTL78330.1 hypothetical protein DAT35_40495 [Vitiosangium sp. GDMCC 1.1324]